MPRPTQPGQAWRAPIHTKKTVAPHLPGEVVARQLRGQPAGEEAGKHRTRPLRRAGSQALNVNHAPTHVTARNAQDQNSGPHLPPRS